MKIKRKKGFFSISAVAKMFSVHQQTIRLYEKEGLIAPKRSAGNTRLFSEEDVNQLEEIIYLTHQLGINLAGVEMIFKLKKQMHKMQKDMNKLFEQTQEELDKETEITKTAAQTSMQRLIAIKKKKELEGSQSTNVADHQQHTISDDPVIDTDTDDDDNWDIEYD